LQDRLSLLDDAAVYDYPLLFATVCYDVDSRSYYYDTVASSLDCFAAKGVALPVETFDIPDPCASSPVAILPSGLSGTLLRHSIVDL
jgi:hypothetical protein